MDLTSDVELSGFTPSPPSVAARARPQAGQGAATTATGTGNVNIDALISGSKWSTLSLTYAFPAAASQYDPAVYLPTLDETSDFRPATGGLIDAVRYAMRQFSDVSGLQVSETGATSTATMLIARTGQAATAFAYLPETAPSKGGDVWFGYDTAFDAPRRGDYAWVTTLHEIGHALGLKHAHAAIGGTGPYEDDTGIISQPVSADRDAIEFTVMSYRSHVGQDLVLTDSYTNEDYGYPQTLMMLDIAALQRMYGADFGTNAGDTVYRFSPSTGEMFINGTGQGAPGANRLFLTIWDGGGTDTYDFSAYTENQSIDLRPGNWSLVSTAQRADLGEGFYASGNVYNALQYEGDGRSLIENATGGTGDDTIVGNAAANVLKGGAGRDSLAGGDGDDQLFGGEDATVTAAQGSVIRLYEATLNRKPDLGGFVGWTRQVDEGATIASIAAGFVDSPEFQKVYGPLSNTEFVRLLYGNVLHRAPDQAGLDGWLSLLNNGTSRAGVVVGFSESPEFQSAMALSSTAYVTQALSGQYMGQIYRLYDSTFDRGPDAAGFRGWVSALESGTTLATASNGFINSAEFQKVYGSLDDNQYVTRLYNNVLNRGPDQGGLDAWVGALKSGFSRADVLISFSESQEHINLMAPGLDAYLETGMASWNDTLAGGSGNNVLSGGRGADDFIFDVTQKGTNWIYGFDQWDQIQLIGFGYSSADGALAHMAQTGRDVTFVDQGVTVVFKDMDIAFFASGNWLI